MLGIFLGCVTAPVFASAATLTLSTSGTNISVGKQFMVKVVVGPGSGESVNAADGKLSYDPSLLSISSFSKDGSAFSLWTSDPTFSNSAGTFSFSGGTPTAFTNPANILIITFTAKKAGKTSLSFASGSILSADGKGTDVYTKSADSIITITDAAPEPVEAPADTGDDTGGGSEPPPLAPAITSLTFSKPGVWYATSTGVFSWPVPADVTGMRTLVSGQPTDIPTGPGQPATSTVIITGIKDGDSYLLAQFKNDAGWGDVGKFEIKVDTVPPKEFNVTLLEGAEGSVTKLSFKAEDALSGIDRYDILLGQKVVTTVKAKDLVDGAYPVPPQDGGPQMVTIRAYDIAGNMREAKSELTLPKVLKASGKSTDGTEVPVAPTPTWTIERILCLLFALIIGAIASWMYYYRKGVAQEQAKVLHMVMEIADKNDRVFSAMREEFEQLVRTLDNKPQMTPNERQLLERIKEVLDISEEIIDSGVEGLKKMLRNQ